MVQGLKLSKANERETKTFRQADGMLSYKTMRCTGLTRRPGINSELNDQCLTSASGQMIAMNQDKYTKVNCLTEDIIGYSAFQLLTSPRTRRKA